MTQHVICRSLSVACALPEVYLWLYSGGRATIAARGAAFHSRWGRGRGGGGERNALATSLDDLKLYENIIGSVAILQVIGSVTVLFISQITWLKVVSLLRTSTSKRLPLEGPFNFEVLCKRKETFSGRPEYKKLTKTEGTYML